MLKDPNICKVEIFNVYDSLKKQYKDKVFRSDETCLLDRHKIASCMCGAILKVSVFDTGKMEELIKKQPDGVEAYFYYVNELTAFVSSCRIMGMFMMRENKGNIAKQIEIMENFPIMPDSISSKQGAWNTVLFNLSQIKDLKQIGAEHYDIYAYAMQFFMLESYYKKVIDEETRNKDVINSLGR